MHSHTKVVLFLAPILGCGRWLSVKTTSIGYISRDFDFDICTLMLSLLQVKNITGQSRDGSAKKLSDKGCMLPMRWYGAPCIYIFFMQLWVRVERQVFVWVKGRQELLRLVSFQTPSSRGRSRSHKCWIRRTGPGNETSTSCPRASRCQGSLGHCTCMHVGCSLFNIVCVGH